MIIERDNSETYSIPIEDIGIVILESLQITISNYLLSKFLENNVAVIVCNEKHLPKGLLLNLVGNSIQSERFRIQINTKLPIKKKLWSQTIEYKIVNQSKVIEYIKKDNSKLIKWSKEIKSGDSTNVEAKAAAFYWNLIFSDYLIGFNRGRFEEEPNNLLNYGYSILRAIVARALVSTGLLPTLGIKHSNKYNPFCLADDIMEPYRPYVDLCVLKIIKEEGSSFNYELTTEIKKKLLQIPTIDVTVDGYQKPLMVAVSTTTSSLYECFNGERTKIKYPKL